MLKKRNKQKDISHEKRHHGEKSFPYHNRNKRGKIFMNKLDKDHEESFKMLLKVVLNK